jgi:hypothetical protein
MGKTSNRQLRELPVLRSGYFAAGVSRFTLAKSPANGQTADLDVYYPVDGRGYVGHIIRLGHGAASDPEAESLL